MRWSPDLTENELTFPRIPKAPRLPRLYVWMPEDDDDSDDLPGSDRTEGRSRWMDEARSCAAFCMAGMAAVLLCG